MVGGLWLDALKMTVIPLIIALLVTGIVSGADQARAGGIAGRSFLWFVIVLTAFGGIRRAGHAGAARSISAAGESAEALARRARQRRQPGGRRIGADGVGLAEEPDPDQPDRRRGQ